MTRYILIALLLVASACQRSEEAVPVEPVALERTPSPVTAAVYFVAPADRDTVSNPIRVEFGLKNMDVAPAGTDAPNTGHHHLLIDTELPDLGQPIPADEQHVHFGDGSTSTELTLAPGEHTLQLLLADYRHIPHDPPVMSERITISVE